MIFDFWIFTIVYYDGDDKGGSAGIGSVLVVVVVFKVPVRST